MVTGAVRAYDWNRSITPAHFVAFITGCAVIGWITGCGLAILISSRLAQKVMDTLWG